MGQVERAVIDVPQVIDNVEYDSLWIFKCKSVFVECVRCFVGRPQARSVGGVDVGEEVGSLLDEIGNSVTMLDLVPESDRGIRVVFKTFGDA